MEGARQTGGQADAHSDVDRAGRGAPPPPPPPPGARARPSLPLPFPARGRSRAPPGPGPLAAVLLWPDKGALRPNQPHDNKKDEEEMK